MSTLNIHCSVEEVKRMIVKAQKRDPDETFIPTWSKGGQCKLWELVPNHDVTSYMAFAAMLIQQTFTISKE